MSGNVQKNRKSSLIARIFGGLGNQMFVYAHARATALRNEIPLLLDTVSGFKNDPYCREWSLQHFNIQIKEATESDSFDYPGGRIVRGLLKAGNRAGVLHNYIMEPDAVKFHPEMAERKITRKTWVEGYWQSPRYFEEFAQVIRNDFQLITPLSTAATDMLEQINRVNAVGLHARRLRNILVGEEHSKIKSLSLDYYRKAIKFIAEKVDNPHFFCFSDAPEWLEQQLEIPFPHTMVTFNQGRDDRNYEDFALMSACNHFVISNSTYAWWAAWLGDDPDKVVVAPDLAFWDNQDILPVNWNRI